jgi:hypothetical protein
VLMEGCSSALSSAATQLQATDRSPCSWIDVRLELGRGLGQAPARNTPRTRRSVDRPLPGEIPHPHAAGDRPAQVKALRIPLGFIGADCRTGRAEPGADRACWTRVAMMAPRTQAAAKHTATPRRPRHPGCGER